MLGLQLGHFLIIYLGVPLVFDKLKDCDFQPLIDKIISRISSWTAKYLSFAGRLQLIGPVINSMVNY